MTGIFTQPIMSTEIVIGAADFPSSFNGTVLSHIKVIVSIDSNKNPVVTIGRGFSTLPDGSDLYWYDSMRFVLLPIYTIESQLKLAVASDYLSDLDTATAVSLAMFVKETTDRIVASPDAQQFM